MCSEFVFFHCRKRNQTTEISVTTSRAAFCKWAKSCSLWSSLFFRLMECNSKFLTTTDFTWKNTAGCCYAAIFTSPNSLFHFQTCFYTGLNTVIALVHFTFERFQLLLELRWKNVDGSFFTKKNQLKFNSALT